jgi:pimeloyl-ACP methyl ester carboxylesterase
MDDRQSVVLVNGLWMPGAMLWLLAGRLRRAGFRVYTFTYPSVRQDLRANAARLHEFLARIPGATVHLVGYSLGGLVLRALFHFHPAQRPGRIALLGSPQRGSHAARALAGSRFGRRLLGHSMADLNAGVPQAWPWPPRDTGVIAGTAAFGLGCLITPLPPPHDGTVSLDETTLPQAGDRVVLPVTHFGMLLSGRVAREVAQFLRGSRFTH